MFTITNEQINLIISNASGVISDLMPLILLLLGVFIGVYIITGLFLRDEKIEQTKHFIENEDDFFDY